MTGAQGPTPSPTRLGRYIRQRRGELGLTQEELARRAGLKQTNISTIERGYILEPGPERLEAIAIALGVDLSVLVELTEQRRYHVVRVDDDARTVPVYGYIPADSVRFTAPLADLPAVAVPAEMLEGAQDPYGLIVTGDCLLRAGIASGDVVILDRPHGRKPRSGQIVAVRLLDEVTLKRWFVTDDGHVELLDGEDRIVATLDGRESAEVIGLYVWHVPDPARGRG